MARVIHFEISADDPERASSFYATVFGWQIHKWEGPQDYWLASTGERDTPGIDGAIMPRTSTMPPVVNTLDVESLDEMIDKVVANGGKVVEPKTTIPGVGHMAYCQDTEGNVFGMMQRDGAAA